MKVGQLIIGQTSGEGSLSHPSFPFVQFLGLVEAIARYCAVEDRAKLAEAARRLRERTS